MRRVIGVVVAIVLVLSVACGSGEKPSQERPASVATIAIVQPKAGDVVTGKTMKVKLELDGGKIVDVVSQDLTNNEGHVHVSVDGKLITQTFGLTQKLDTPKDGRHLLQAEFVAKDHGPFNPRVLSTVTFEAKR